MDSYCLRICRTLLSKRKSVYTRSFEYNELYRYHVSIGRDINHIVKSHYTKNRWMFDFCTPHKSLKDIIPDSEVFVHEDNLSETIESWKMMKALKE